MTSCSFEFPSGHISDGAFILLEHSVAVRALKYSYFVLVYAIFSSRDLFQCNINVHKVVKGHFGGVCFL